MKKTNDSLEKEKTELTPVFASHESKIEFSEEHSLIKSTIVELTCLWKNYSDTLKEIRKNPGGNEVLKVSIEDISLRIFKLLRELGDALYNLLNDLEGINFLTKYKEFEDAQATLCQTACSILHINKNSLTPDLVIILGDIEYLLFKSLTMGQSISKKRMLQEHNWIKQKQYEVLKYLYKNCRYNIREYLNIYKIVSQNIKEQKAILFDISVSNEINADFLDRMSNQFMAENLIAAHNEIYNELSLDGKIQHHELSIYQRRLNIDRIIKYHKRVINEVDIINWCVGKEAKNIVNMEKTMHGRYELSMKKLFSLFESSIGRLKEYEETLSRYSKLASSSKRAEISENRLFQIKSLNFNYLILEGNLKRLKEDVELLHSASKEIYNRRSEVLKENI